VKVAPSIKTKYDGGKDRSRAKHGGVYMTSKKFFLKAPVLLALGAALVFGACDTNAPPPTPLTPAVLYGRWFYDGQTYKRTAVISANRFRLHNYIGSDSYLEVAIDSWKEAFNAGTDNATYPAGYKITGKITAVKGFSGSVGATYTKDLYLSNDRKAWHTDTAANIIYIGPLPKGD
jgi:hypothetical protein